MVKSCSSFIFAPIANISAKRMGIITADVYKRQTYVLFDDPAASFAIDMLVKFYEFNQSSGSSHNNMYACFQHAYLAFDG